MTGAQVGAARRLRVFLCHASADKPKVRELYQWLRRAGFQPWLDEEDLLPGQRWPEEIPKAVRATDVVLVCLSRNSVTKEGYVQKEIKFALDLADEKPEGTIFLIPIKLEECSIPERLSSWHYLDLTRTDCYEKLQRALHLRAESLSLSTELVLEPDELLRRLKEQFRFHTGWSTNLYLHPDIPPAKRAQALLLYKEMPWVTEEDILMLQARDLFGTGKENWIILPSGIGLSIIKGERVTKYWRFSQFDLDALMEVLQTLPDAWKEEWRKKLQNSLAGIAQVFKREV
jgi:TIR domain